VEAGGLDRFTPCVPFRRSRGVRRRLLGDALRTVNRLTGRGEDGSAAENGDKDVVQRVANAVYRAPVRCGWQGLNRTVGRRPSTPCTQRVWHAL